MRLFEEFKEYETLWDADLTEAAMTAEEKVDAWYKGTRPVNYKAAKEDKLKKYLDIATAKGYLKIVDIIKDELAARAPEEVGPEVYVDGEIYNMPKSFYLAFEDIDTEIENIDIGQSSRDAYDDHYFDGEEVQWRSMWNLFDVEEMAPAGLNVLEKKLDEIAKHYSSRLGVDIDRGMLEDEGVLNICLSYN